MLLYMVTSFRLGIGVKIVDSALTMTGRVLVRTERRAPHCTWPEVLLDIIVTNVGLIRLAYVVRRVWMLWVLGIISIVVCLCVVVPIVVVVNTVNGLLCGR